VKLSGMDFIPGDGKGLCFENAPETRDMPEADQSDGNTKIRRCPSYAYVNPEHVSTGGNRKRSEGAE